MLIRAVTENAVCDPHFTGYHSIHRISQYITRFHRMSQYTGYYRISHDFYSISQYHGKAGTLGHSPYKFVSKSRNKTTK